MFTPGNSYWVLDASDYAILQEAMEIYLAEHEGATSFLSDFTQSDDGWYVAQLGSIDADEAEFLTSMGIGMYTDYKKSTQSTSFF